MISGLPVDVRASSVLISLCPEVCWLAGGLGSDTVDFYLLVLKRKMATLMFVFLAVFVRKQVVAYTKGPGCGALLTGNIVDKTVIVKGSVNSSFDGKRAFLNSSNGWCSADVDPNQYLIIKLAKPATITRLDIQGRSSSDQFVKTFTLGYKSTKDQPHFYYLEKKFFATPSSGDEIVHFQVNTTVMHAVAFYPSDWNGHICMRVELYGCVRVNGGYTPWSKWNSCSTSCGSGTQVRRRECSNPAPANNGQNCSGESSQERDCVGTSCPVDGGYTPWSDWSSCSNLCGNGIQVRRRECSNPSPANNGHNCSGESIQARDCVGTSCPVDGGLSNWSKWTPCSRTCGTGIQLRFRRCTKPPPKFGGKLCEGNSSQGRTCQLMRHCQVQQSLNSGKRNDKYFIPMVLLTVALILFVVIAVGVFYSGKVMWKRVSEKKDCQEKKKWQIRYKPSIDQITKLSVLPNSNLWE